MKQISRFIKNQKHYNFRVDFGVDGGFDVEQFRETSTGWFQRRIYGRNQYKVVGSWRRTAPRAMAFFQGAHFWKEMSLCALKRLLKASGMNYKP